ncbi:MAG: hypothetical protein H6Q73_2415 [Firmicutes bacterium]|nr:hypothetical protein [Bacillota bacterium]
MQEQRLSVVDLGGGYWASPLWQVREIVKRFEAVKYHRKYEKGTGVRNILKKNTLGADAVSSSKPAV